MDRGTMRSLLRERVKDENSIWWADAKLDEQLNLSAQQVSIALEKVGFVTFSRKTQALPVTNGATKLFSLSNTDIYRPLYLQVEGSPDVKRAGRLINESERHQYFDRFPDGRDETGLWIYWLQYVRGNPAVDDPPTYVIEFLVAPTSGIQFQFVYIKRIPEIPTGSGSDTEGYVDIPPDHHEAIVEHAATVLLGHEGNPMAQAAGQHLGALIQAAASRPEAVDKGEVQ